MNRLVRLNDTILARINAYNPINGINRSVPICPAVLISLTLEDMRIFNSTLRIEVRGTASSKIIVIVQFGKKR